MCTLKKIKIVIQPAGHISIYAQSACHTMYHVSEYAQSYEGAVFSGKKKVLQGCKLKRKFNRGENRK